jgi:hypothetical protein
MIIIRFLDEAGHRRALGWLCGRFSFKSWSDGRMMVPSAALDALAGEEIPFISEGAASYEQIAELHRSPARTAI